ncbi:hypothetical protein [Alloscardovia criceti]|uniref:hypothetical protein n=1 Tax=Alloscardovia criceti TaxID=356828 RepID=UPI0012E9F448|nr:hypothetical protein [Alloscardovia criceti]
MDKQQLTRQSQILGISTFLGAIAGLISALAFIAMKQLQHLLWNGRDGFWEIFLIVSIGGCIIAALTWLKDSRLEPIPDLLKLPDAHTTAQPAHTDSADKAQAVDIKPTTTNYPRQTCGFPHIHAPFSVSISR